MKYLFCVGAQKAATSYLYKLLEQHTEICFSEIKEMHFFDSDSNYKKGINSFNKLFESDANTKYLADFTPAYLPTEKALSRISKHFKEQAKLIVILRDPVKRAFSHYNMNINQGRENRPFEKMVAEEIKKEQAMTTILGRGKYAEQLDTLFKYFDSEQVLVLSFDDFTKDTPKAVTEILNFLQLD